MSINVLHNPIDLKLLKVVAGGNPQCVDVLFSFLTKCEWSCQFSSEPNKFKNIIPVEQLCILVLEYATKLNCSSQWNTRDNIWHTMLEEGLIRQYPQHCLLMRTHIILQSGSGVTEYTDTPFTASIHYIRTRFHFYPNYNHVDAY